MLKADNNNLASYQKKISEKISKLGSLQNLDSNLIKNLGDWMRMELTYTSNAIEGNTLTRKETKLVVEDGISIGGKSVIEILEVKNHHAALQLVEQLAIEYRQKRQSNKPVNSGLKRISIDSLFNIHSAILNGINDENAGYFRNVAVRISGSTTILPNYLRVPDLVDKMLDEINLLEIEEINQEQIQSFKKDDVNFDNKMTMIDLAIKTHYDLVSIHPFIDGNGRTARLLFNLVLLQNDLPIVFIAKKDRSEYLSALEKAQNGGSSDDYYILMYKAVIRSLDLYLEQTNNTLRSKQTTHPTLLKIGQLAKKTNESVANIRYWTKLGLLKVYNLTPSGYSLYHPDDIQVVKQIRFLQVEKRLSLEEIKSVLI